jgi:hypothetical protein
MNMLGLSSSLHFTHIACYWKFFLSHYTKSSVSTGFAEEIMPILHILCYNGSLVTWMVISLTTAKFKPLIFPMFGFNLSYTANMILYDFCLLPLQFCYIITEISRSRSLLPATRRHAHSWNRAPLRPMAIGLGSSLYSLGANPTENTASNSPSIVVMGGSRAIVRISFRRERVYRVFAQKQPFFCLLHSNGCTRYLIQVLVQQRVYTPQYATGINKVTKTMLPVSASLTPKPTIGHSPQTVASILCPARPKIYFSVILESRSSKLAFHKRFPH